MKKLNLLFIIIAIQVYSQTYKITYGNFFDGKPTPQKNNTVVLASEKETYIVNQDIISGKATVPYEIFRLSTENALDEYAFLKNDEVAYFQDKNLLSKYTFEHKNETKKILGYLCKKSVTVVNSNTFEIWHTNALGVKGSPQILGSQLGLVLEVVRNGSQSTKAIEIKKLKKYDASTFLKNKKITNVEALDYKDLLWKSRFTTLPVFQEETIHFVGDPQSTDEVKKFAKGTVILKKVKFPEIQRGENIFVELSQFSNGDAYDRTGSVFIIPEDKEKSFFDALNKGIDSVPNFKSSDGKTYKGMVATADYAPALELMRFFTPFGIQKYNSISLKGKTWHNVAKYRSDISEIQPELSGKELWVGAYIGNYDKGGHKISMEITIHPNEGAVFNNNFVLPLFNTVNLMESAGQGYATLFGAKEGLKVEFTIDKDVKNAKLRYITTGHGGWGQGDEFVPKENTILIDDKKAFSFIPWRTDCGSYRLYNPASGNFENGLSSSDYSRSNWCPGTVTNPEYIYLGDLKAGTHTVQILIPQGEPNGSNFSYWSVSGALLGEK